MAEHIRVVGLDLSLTATGIATITHGAPLDVAVNTIRSAGHRDDTLDQRHLRMDLISVRITQTFIALQPALVVLEGPSLGSATPHTWDRAGLWWRVVSGVLEADWPLAVVPPSTLKKFATAKGNADKTAVAVGMSKMWPHVQPANDNEWDSLALAHIGAARLGLDVPQRAHHPAVLASITWPDGLITDEEPMRA